MQAADRAGFERNGFLVARGLMGAALCDSLRTRMAELVDGMNPAELASVFSTRDHRHGRDRYFLDSGYAISFFLEEEAVDAAGWLTRPRELAINKVGHALHDLDPTFDHFSRRPELAAIASALGLADPRLLQSMYIFKQPMIGGEVGCHQDSSFIHTEPQSCLGLWFALEDATRENGCLWAEPGGHRRPLHQRFRRDDERTWMDVVDPAPLQPDRLVPLEAAKGDIVVLHGRLPHQSGPNRSARSRHAYTLHLIDGTCRYSPDNWLQRPIPPRGFH